LRSRRLLLVSPTFWPEPIGTPRYATDTARWFRDHGWQVAVVTAQPFYPDFARYPGWGAARRRDQVDGIPILRMPTVVPPAGRVAGRMASDVNFALQTAVRALQRTVPAPDAVLTFSPGVPLAVPAAAAFVRDVPHVGVVHDIQAGLARATGMAGGRLLAAVTAVERMCMSLPNHLLVLSDAMADQLRDMGVTTPIEVVPIWTDIPIAEDVAPPSRSGRPTALYSGNLGRKQGIPLLLDAAEELQRRGSPVRLVLRGRGPLGDTAAAAVVERQLRSVELAELLPEHGLAGGLREADLHLVPQLPGGGAAAMPSKVLNIMASGRPMLAICEIGDPLHRLADDGLCLWAPVDAGAVASAIDAAIADPRPGMSAARSALQHVRRHHDRDLLLDRVAALLV
jgi:colanic acid biosynthesis glycosyl transferase WcaI